MELQKAWGQQNQQKGKQTVNLKDKFLEVSSQASFNIAAAVYIAVCIIAWTLCIAITLYCSCILCIFSQHSWDALCVTQTWALQLQVCARFPPVFHHFFLESFPDPAAWFEARSRYTRSTAVNSMAGYLVGLGDRHMGNILLDMGTAEVSCLELSVLSDCDWVQWHHLGLLQTVMLEEQPCRRHLPQF